MDMYVYIIKIFLETVYFEHTYLTSSHMVSGNYWRAPIVGTPTCFEYHHADHGNWNTQGKQPAFLQSDRLSQHAGLCRHKGRCACPNIRRQSGIHSTRARSVWWWRRISGNPPHPVSPMFSPREAEHGSIPWKNKQCGGNAFGGWDGGKQIEKQHGPGFDWTRSFSSR